ncbi:MAG: hypothetical protein OXC57_12160 [Rhodobacteraceae bacterium]|nr:hypothetical protein [Paracoccaceae bacterium]
MKRISTMAAVLVAIIGGGQLAAEPCEVWVGFETRHLTLFEGQSGTLKVTAEFNGPIADDYVLEVPYQTDPVPFWQQNQPNEAEVGQHGGTSLLDYESKSGTARLTKSNPSYTIQVTAKEDDESEDWERFHVNLQLPWSFDDFGSTHRTREESCSDPARHFRQYGYFATVNIRDGAGFPSNHWLFGSDN